jgi:CubicO group peptidase (beta-lactamase class C family)
MLLNKGELDGTRLLGRKTVDYMATNHLSQDLLPIGIGVSTFGGVGFGLGFSMILDPAQNGILNSKGNYGWGGAAATNFWVDPQEEIVGLIMTQLMDNMLPFQDEFRAMTYQALID